MLKVRLGNEDIWDLEQYQYNAQIMGDVNLTSDIFVASGSTAFDVDMYVIVNDEPLYLTSAEPTGEKNPSNTLEKYTLYFESKRNILKRKYFRDLTSDGLGVDWGTSFSFYANIYDFVDRLQKNLDKYFGVGGYTIYIAEGHSTTKVLFTADNLYLHDSLNTMSEIYGVEWKISAEGDVFRIDIDPEYELISHTFAYEGTNAGSGLTLVQKNIDTSNIITRMLSAGSTKNVPYGYFRDYSEQGYLADPNPAPSIALGFFNLMPKCFREYIKGWNGQSFGAGIPTSAYNKGVSDKALEIYDPVTYYDYNISKWGIREGVVEVNEEIFPTITNQTKTGLGYIDEVVAVEQVKFDNEEAYRVADDKDNILERKLDFISILSNTISGSTELNVSDVDLLNTIVLDNLHPQLVFDISLILTLDPNPNKVSNRTINVIVEKKTGEDWVPEYSFLIPTIKGYDHYHQKEVYTADVKNLIFLNPTLGEMRLKFAAKISIPSNTSSIFCNIDSNIKNIRITNANYGKQKTISNLFHTLNCTNDLNNSIAYSDDFTITETPPSDEDYEVTILAAKLLGKVQYDRNIPNPNDEYGTLVFDNSIILQQQVSGNWIDYDIKKVTYDITRVDSILPGTGSAWLAANIVGERTFVFEALPIGTYRIKTLLSISKNQVGSITPQATYVTLDLQNIYYRKKGYKPTFYVWLKDVFDLKQENLYLTGTGVDPQINFTTGSLAGDEYAFKFDPAEVIEDTSKTLADVPSKWRLTCYKSIADQQATGLMIPNTKKQGNAGDKFVFLGINMPYDPYVLNAERRLEDYVKAELDKVSDVKRDFSLELYDPFIETFLDRYKLIPSNYIKVSHPNLISGSYLEIQIKGLTITQSKGAMFPKYALELSEKSSIIPLKKGGIIGKLQNDTEALYKDTQVAFRDITSIGGDVRKKTNTQQSEAQSSLAKGIGSNAHVLLGNLPLGKNVAGIFGSDSTFTVFGEEGSLEFEILNIVKWQQFNFILTDMTEALLPNGNPFVLTSNNISWSDFMLIHNTKRLGAVRFKVTIPESTSGTLANDTYFVYVVVDVHLAFKDIIFTTKQQDYQQSTNLYFNIGTIQVVSSETVNFYR